MKTLKLVLLVGSEAAGRAWRTLRDCLSLGTGKAAVGLVAALTLSAGAAFGQQPDLSLNPGSNYVEIGRGIAWGASFNRVYLLTPSSPNSSVCVYVVNNNPTNSHTFTLNVFQAADPRLNNYSAYTGRYQAVTINGTPSPVAASSMSSAFVNSTAAAVIALQFSGSAPAGGSPDTADAFAVQSSNSSCGTVGSVLNIQGSQAAGSAASENPVLIGGLDGSGNVNDFRLINGPDNSVHVYSGISIGDGNLAPIGSQTTGNRVTFPSGDAGGPLGALAYGQAPSTNVYPLGMSRGSQTGDSELEAPTLFVAQSGWYGSVSLANIQTNTTNPLWQVGSMSGIFTSCWFYANVSAVTGTTPTLDLFVQDSGDGTVFDDRIHFAQFTAVSRQVAALYAAGGFNPRNTGDGVLAASTRIDGPLGPGARYKFVVGGTTPNFTIQLISFCK